MVEVKEHVFRKENARAVKLETGTTMFDNSGIQEEVLVTEDKQVDLEGKVTLVVPFAHQVLVIKDGEMLETFSSGKHLITDVEIKKSGFFRKEVPVYEPHDYQVFYINSEVTLLCKWGTPNTIKIMDPFLKVPVNVGAHGSFDVHVVNSRKFMLKMVGDKQGLTTEGLKRFFADKMVMRVKDVLANAMVTTGINAYELPTKLIAISEAIIQTVEHIFDEYGVEIKNFSINNIHIPSEDTKVLEDIIKKKRILEMQDKSFKSEEDKQRQNLQFAADMTVKLAEIEAKKVPTKVNININGADSKYCSKCGHKIEGNGKFCPNCGKEL